MIVLKEKANHQLQEEKTIHEKSLSEQLAASLQVQASLKTEMANMLQHLHLEENKRRQESEQQFMRMGDAMVTQHTLEIETLKEKHMRELKRLRAELDVQHEDQLNKVKHMHEQELNRQIRITDRLQRVLARHGLGSSALPTSYQPSRDRDRPHFVGSDLEEDFQHNLTPKQIF